MPVSDAYASASDTNPHAHTGTGWSASTIPAAGMWTWPSSPPIPDAPVMIRPSWMTPPPRPVPTIADTDDRSIAMAPKCA